MGIFIKLHIAPNKINVDDWNSVYSEALQLIKAYPFLDIVSSKETYHCTWNYADIPAEHSIKYCSNELGFRLMGDLMTMEYGESFELIKNLNYYRTKTNASGDCEDILSIYLGSRYLGTIRHDDGTTTVFDSKTQGYDYHLYILAIACLFEHRLSPYALADGDISKGQMESAVNWANSVLDKPIKISQRANNQVLLNRLKKISTDEKVHLETFMDVTLNAENYDLGCFIRENFSTDTIIKFYKDKVAICRIGTYAFSDIINSYLNLGHSMPDLCQICITGSNKSVKDVSGFVRAILDLGIYLDFTHERNQRKQAEQDQSFQSEDPRSTAPDSVESLFGKVFGRITKGNINQTEMYISLQDLTVIFESNFGGFVDIKAIMDEYFIKKGSKNTNESSVIEAPAVTKNKKIITEPYDITSLKQLIQLFPVKLHLSSKNTGMF